MMRKIISYFMFFITSIIIGQNAYHDAVEIANKELNGWSNALNKFQIVIPAEEINVYKDIFINYGLNLEPNDDGEKIHEKLEDLFKDNPFIFIAPRGQDDGALAAQAITSTSPFSISSIGGLNVTNIADGAAKFLVKRTKQELTVAFFDRFEEIFDDYPEFGILFPNTARTFRVIESFNFSAYLNSLRQSFLKDLENLHLNIAQLETLQKYNGFFTSNGGLLFKTALDLVEEFKRGTNPAGIITAISTSPNFNSLADSEFKNLKNAVKLSDLISQSLLSKDEDKIWVSAAEIRRMIEDPTTLKIFLGLVYQLEDTATIEFETATSSSIKLRDLLASLAGNLSSIENYLKNLTQDVDNVNAAVTQLRSLKKLGSSPNHSDYYSYYSGLISFATNVGKVDALGITLTHQKEIDTFINLSETAGNIYHNLSSQSYSAAVLDIRILLEEVGINIDSDVINEFMKYGSFMAAVAEAENSDEVQAAIEAVALPAGSASIKRKTDFNIALNAFVGVAGGPEYNGNTEEYKFSFAVNAPIGVGLSWGHFKINDAAGSTKKFKEFGSSTVFVTLVDLGAVTSFRFGDDTTEQLPEIKLENIIAPGLYYVYGIPKVPISVGLGGQLGPQLRKVTTSDIQLSNKASFSFRLFIAVDIPLLNFYTKSR